MVKGKCYYCNKDLTERTIKRHIKSCPNIKKTISDEIDVHKGTRNQFIISMKDKYDKAYCIYLSIDENLQLQHLDQFIRDIWVECCDHLSSFYIDGMTYDDNRNNLYEMNVKLKEVLSVGQKFEYQYDFGSTTHIILEVVDKIEVSKKHSQIEILARNNEINYNCSECGKKAQYYQYGTGNYLCEECADKLDEDDFEEYGIEELYGNYFNSPRDGVCGYVGDKDAELPYMPGNNNIYKISRKKPQLEDDEFDFWDNDRYDYGASNNNLLDKLLNYAASCNGKITEDDVANILEEEFSKMHFNIFEETTNKFLNEITKMFEKGVFSFELEKLLNGYTKLQIKEIAENLNVKISSNSNKNTHIQKLKEMYSECMKNEIYKMDEDKYNKLQKCIKNKGILNDIEENIHNYMFFMEKGILFPAIHNEEPVFVMPAIMQDIFNNMNTLEARNKIKTNTEIIKLFRGMIKAYGILSYDDTIMLLKKYIDNFDEINAITILKENENYYPEEYEVIEEKDIFSENEEEIKLFANFDIEDYEDILLEIDNKMEYSYISKEKLISMADSDYLEKSDLGKNFVKEISNLFVMSKEDAIYNMDVLVSDIQITDINEIIEDEIQNVEIEFGKCNRCEVEQVINKLLRNVPIWKFKGATINQIEGEKTEENFEKKKIGRNEPCPCGSGKKYKNCCGKVIKLF